MYSLLAVASDDPAGSAALGRAASILPDLLPDLGVQTAAHRCDLPEIGGGWVVVSPRPAFAEPLIEESVEPDLAVLFYGVLPGVKPGARAATLAQAWRDGGPDAVRELEGDFSAVWVDRLRREMGVASDGIGRRCVQHARRGGTLAVGSNDLALVASGLVSDELDPVSAASVLSFDFSVAGRSLLAGVHAGRCDEVVHWREGRTRVEHRPPVSLDERLEAADRAGSVRLARSMLDVLGDRVRALAGDESIEVDITAGIDSRACLATAVSVLPRDRIVAFTAGEPDSLDARVGRRVAQVAGVRHRMGGLGRPSWEGFEANLDALACFTSGTVTAKNAIGARRRHNPDATLRIRGGGGEIFHGRYYPTRSHAELGRLTRDDVVPTFLSFFPRHARLPWRDPELPRQVEARAGEVVARWDLPGIRPVDLLDVFYDYERFPRWSLAGRTLINLRSHYLYESPALFRLAWRIPPPIGLSAHVLEEAVRRGIPRAWWIPVNGRRWLPAEGRPRPVRRLARAWMRRRRRRASGRAAGARDPERLRRDGLASILEAGARERIESASSIASALVEADGLRGLIDEHTSGARDRGHVIGLMLTLERWREQLREARRRTP